MTIALFRTVVIKRYEIKHTYTHKCTHTYKFKHVDLSKSTNNKL